LTTPLITRLDLDPIERAHETRGFDEWQENRSWAIAPAIGLVQRFVRSFEDYPPRQESFSPSAAGLTEQLFVPPR